MKTVLQISRPNRAFFFSPETISIGDDIKLKGTLVYLLSFILFFFLHSFIFLLLLCFLYFLPYYMVWRRP